MRKIIKTRSGGRAVDGAMAIRPITHVVDEPGTISNPLPADTDIKSEIQSQHHIPCKKVFVF